MNRFVLYIAVSIDGYIADQDGNVSWLDAFEKDDYGYEEFLEGIGSIVMGRATFEQVIAFGDWPYGDIPTMVWTEKQFEEVPASVELFSGQFSELAGRAKQVAGNKDIWVLGGARTIQDFANAGVIDRYQLFVVPVFLEAGIRLFETGAGDPRLLELVNAQPFANGVVQLEYKNL